MFLQEKVTFKKVEKEKIITEIQKIKDNLRFVISFITGFSLLTNLSKAIKGK